MTSPGRLLKCWSQILHLGIVYPYVHDILENCPSRVTVPWWQKDLLVRKNDNNSAKQKDLCWKRAREILTAEILATE